MKKETLKRIWGDTGFNFSWPNEKRHALACYPDDQGRLVLVKRRLLSRPVSKTENPVYLDVPIRINGPSRVLGIRADLNMVAMAQDPRIRLIDLVAGLRRGKVYYW